MKSEKFTLTRRSSFGRFIKMSMLSAMLTLWYSGAQAQCPLACNNLVQVSMDDNCVVKITADMMLEGQGISPACTVPYVVQVLGTNGLPLALPGNNPETGLPWVGNCWIDSSQVGKTLTVRIWSGANSCWGTIKIEDKLGPVIVCQSDLTVSCYDAVDYAAAPHLPVATDNCQGTVPVTIISNVLNKELDCSSMYRAIREIKFQAKDKYNNLSNICTRVIYYRKIILDSVLCPRNYDGVGANFKHLSCNGTFQNMSGTTVTWDLNNNKYPDPNEVEMPYVMTPGGSVNLTLNSLCKINMTFTDTRINICPQSFKILRNWSILDWCTGTVKSCIQILKVLDNEGPVLTTATRVTSPFCEKGAHAILTTNPYSCTSEFLVDFHKYVINIADCDKNTLNPNFYVQFKKSPYPLDFVLCDNEDPLQDVPFTTLDGETKVLGTPGVLSGANRYRIEGLPLGRSWVRYFVKDSCDNIGFITIEVDVIDKTPPVAVCDEFTVVTLSTNGTSRVFAETFDDGSHDNCTNVGFRVARMNQNGCNSRDAAPFFQTDFGPYIEVCCNDLTATVDINGNSTIEANERGYIQVILEVWDDANQDGKFGPPYAKSGFEDNRNTCMVLVRVDDKTPPVITCPPSVTIACGADTSATVRGIPVYSSVPLNTPYFSDNCPNPTMRWSNSGGIDNCGQGIITRTFTVTDNGGRTATCVQTITVRNMTPYNGPLRNASTGVWNNLANETVTGCMDDIPKPKNGPALGATSCSQVAYTYEDQIFPFVDSVCYKILRKWTVIDWCKFAPNRDPSGTLYPNVPTTNVNTWSYTQVIKVEDTSKPEFTTNPLNDNKVFDILGSDCKGLITLTETAKDCNDKATAALTWKYAVTRGGIAYRSGTTNSESANYDVGTYVITWTVEDRCGNQSSKTYTFTVKDAKKPTPYCISQITTVVMPTSGTIEIWAKDFNLGSTDNCPTTRCGLLYTFNGARPVESLITQVHYFKGN
ncbi:MAG: hypothetical protein WBO36_13670, partial [Saprospiraceae bacterium]